MHLFKIRKRLSPKLQTFGNSKSADKFLNFKIIIERKFLINIIVTNFIHLFK